MGGLSANLHVLMNAFYKPTAERFKILIEEKAFPSDYFIAESQAMAHGYSPEDALIVATPREGEELIRDEDLMGLIKERGKEIAVVLFAGVQFQTGQLFPMERITKAAHEQGCVVGFDLAHAVGNVPLKLHDWGVDFAAWCTYKYLNSGPGGIAGIFVHSMHDTRANPAIGRGWWGTRKETRFEMEHKFEPLPGAAGLQTSNPSVMAMTCLLASLRIFRQTTMEAIREKSFRMVQLLRELLKGAEGVEILTPAGKDCSGAQLSIYPKNVPIDVFMKRIRADGIICDARRNGVIRVAFTGLYNTFQDVAQAAAILKRHCK